MDSLDDFFKLKRSIDIRLESRNSFINNRLISVNGFRAGLAYQRKLRIGGGFSWLNSDVKSNFYVPNSKGTSDLTIKYLKFVYLCGYIDFVFYKTKRWQLSVPIQLGSGVAWFQENRAYSYKNKDAKHFLLLYEPGITVQFKIFKWLGLGTDVAYRFTLKNTKKIGETLNSPTYSFKLLTWFDQLYYQLFPNTNLTKKYGPDYW